MYIVYLTVNLLRSSARGRGNRRSRHKRSRRRRRSEPPPIPPLLLPVPKSCETGFFGFDVFIYLLIVSSSVPFLWSPPFFSWKYTHPKAQTGIVFEPPGLSGLSGSHHAPPPTRRQTNWTRFGRRVGFQHLTKHLEAFPWVQL